MVKDFAGLNTEMSTGCDVLNHKNKEELITKIITEAKEIETSYYSGLEVLNKS